MEQTYKLIIAYDGTDFHGWQEQAHAHTVMSALQNSFRSVFFKTCKIVGASRTDAGVHAQGQVARLQTDLLIDPLRLTKAWNFRLPTGIMILSSTRVDNTFNPRKNVLQKTYTYRLFTTFPDPWIGRFGWLYPFMHYVDIPTFEAVLQRYVGTHDFSSFCKYQESVSPIKTIHSIAVTVEPTTTPSLLVTIKGPSFAQYQIRRMIGYALDASRRPATAHTVIQSLLDRPNHEQTLTKANASGLTLQTIEYSDASKDTF